MGINGGTVERMAVCQSPVSRSTDSRPYEVPPHILCRPPTLADLQPHLFISSPRGRLREHDGSRLDGEWLQRTADHHPTAKLARVYWATATLPPRRDRSYPFQIVVPARWSPFPETSPGSDVSLTTALVKECCFTLD